MRLFTLQPVITGKNKAGPELAGDGNGRKHRKFYAVFRAMCGKDETNSCSFYKGWLNPDRKWIILTLLFCGSSEEEKVRMKGRMRPYLPELTIRDYNIYLRYLRGVRRQLYEAYGLYSCHLLRSNGVLFAILSDSLAGRQATCQRKRVPGTLAWRRLMCQTQGIRLAAQVEVLLGWHNLQDRKYSELRPLKRLRRAVDRLLLRRAYERAVQENPALERLFVQERDQAVVQMNLSAKNYSLAAEPMSNIYGALYSTLATDDPSQRKSMRYIGSSIGRIFYLLDKAERFEMDKSSGRYNVFVVNDLRGQAAAVENARRQALAAANDLIRVYSMLDIKLNRGLLDNIMLLGLHHAVDPLEAGAERENWEIP